MKLQKTLSKQLLAELENSTQAKFFSLKYNKEITDFEISCSEEELETEDCDLTEEFEVRIKVKIKK